MNLINSFRAFATWQYRDGAAVFAKARAAIAQTSLSPRRQKPQTADVDLPFLNLGSIGRHLPALLIVLLLPYSPLFGQTYNGSITGVVSDPSMRNVPHARVEIQALATSAVRVTESSETGEFGVYDLPVGKYRLTATAPGFSSYIIDNIVVAAGAAIRIPVRLSVAQGSTTVTVTSDAVVLDKETANLNAVVANSAVQRMPLNGRDFTQLVKLAPGVNALNSANGGRLGQNSWYIDGIDDKELFYNASSINNTYIAVGNAGLPTTILPLDAIDQFAVTSGGSPEYGNNTGAAVNLAIKSGTNDLHGSLYYFNRNDALAATPPFAATTPKLKNNQFGGSVGGPLVKNRLFYFLAYEKQKLIVGNSSPATEPSQAYVAEATAVLAQYNVPVNPVATNLLAFWPANGRTGAASPNNFVGTANSLYSSDNAIAKFDYNINPKNTLSVRYFLATGGQNNLLSSPYPNFFQVTLTHAQNAGMVYTSTLSSHAVNQFSVGANYLGQNYRDADTSFNPLAAGLNTGVVSLALAGAPSLSITGFDVISPVTPIVRDSGTGQVKDTFTYLIGHHQFRVGAEYRRAGACLDFERNKRGSFTFNGSQGSWASNAAITANVKSLADFLAGNVASSTIARGDLGRDYRENGLDLFVQDTFHLSPQLSLNYGLHYSYYSPLRDLTDSISTFVPSLGGLVTPGHGISSLYPADKTNFAPRFGIAFAPSRRPRFVLRAGSGIFYNSPTYGGFIDNRPPNSGAAGVEANPAGPSPVYTLTRTNYKIVADQPIFGTSSPQPPFGIFSISQAYQTNYAINSNLNIQYELSRGTVLQVGYVSTLARHLPIALDINQAATSALGAKTTSAQAQVTRPYYAQFPQYGTINEQETIGTSNYNALQASLTTASWKSLSAHVSYTYGHSLDYASSEKGFTPTSSLNLKQEYGSSDFDIKHTFNAFITYSIPSVAHVPRVLGAGWQANGFFSFSTGLPFTVFAGQNVSGTFEGHDRVNIVGDPFAGETHVLTKTGIQWINPAAFAMPAPGTFGNERRNSLRGPGFADVDLSLVKSFKLAEKVSAQFRVEMFNAFNRVNLGQISLSSSGGVVSNQNLSSGSFGLISSTYGTWRGAYGIGSGEPYNTQLALRIVF